MSVAKFSLPSKESLALRAWSLIIAALILVVIGLLTYKDYGISWDERVERLDGAVALRFIEQKTGYQIPGLDDMLDKQQYSGSLQLHSYKDRYYPVGFNLPVEGIIRLFDIRTEQAAYYFRHLVTLTISLLGVFAIFYLAERRFSDWRIGFLAALMYVLSPRLYGEWFYNSKDLVLLSFFAIAMNFAIVFLQKPGIKNTALFAITTALAMNIRLMAIVLPLLTFCMLFFQLAMKRIDFYKAIFSIFLYSSIVAALLVLMWPLLWENPIDHLFDALVFMAKYQFKQDVLYFGRVISSTALPWHYLPVWVAITTPIGYLIFWCIGLLGVSASLIRSKTLLWNTRAQLQDIFFLGLFLGPVLGFIILRPVIYDGWRHLYFIYPSFLLISVRGLMTVAKVHWFSGIAQKLFIAITVCSMLSTGIWMVWAHPLQGSYFNYLVGSNWKSKFDLDYWGLSNRQALTYILNQDKRDHITVIDGAYNFLPLTLSILGEADASRLTFVKSEGIADYLISNYRLNITDHGAIPSNWELMTHIYVGKEIASSIYKAKRIIYSPNVRVDQPIAFGKTGFGQFFLKMGDWALPEAWGVWALAQKSSVYMPFPDHSQGSLSELVLNFRALVAPSHPYQRIAIRVNDGIPITFDLRGLDSNLIVLKLPNSILLDKRLDGLVVEIESLNPVKPSEINIGDDTRLLSVGLVSATFK